MSSDQISGLARIDELQKKFAESPRRFFAPLANEYRKAGNAQRAIEICRENLAQQPNHMSGQVVLGQALFDAGMLDESREAFEHALSLDPENLIALRHLGDIARSAGDMASARSWYEQVLDVDPRNHAVITILREIDEVRSAGEMSSAEIEQPQTAAAASTSFEGDWAGAETNGQTASREEPADTSEVVGAEDVEEEPTTASGPWNEPADMAASTEPSQAAAQHDEGDSARDLAPPAEAAEPDTEVEETPSAEVVSSIEIQYQDEFWSVPEPLEDAGTSASDIQDLSAERSGESALVEASAHELAGEAQLTHASPEPESHSAAEVPSREEVADSVAEAAREVLEEPASEPASEQAVSAGEMRDSASAANEAEEDVGEERMAAAEDLEIGMTAAAASEAPAEASTRDEGANLDAAESVPVEKFLGAEAYRDDQPPSDGAEFETEPAELPVSEESSELDPELAESVSESTEELDDALAWEMEMLASEMSAPTSGEESSDWLSEFEASSSADDFVSVEEEERQLVSEDESDALRPPGVAGASDESGGGRASGSTLPPGELPRVEPVAEVTSYIPEHAAGEPVEEEVAPPGDEPAVFVTETMAQLYEQQGYLELASGVYRQLLERSPDNQSYRRRLAELDARISPAEEPAPTVRGRAASGAPTARAFFSSLTKVRLRPRLARPYVSGRNEGGNQPTPSEEEGAPARDAGGDLSLESVFRYGGSRSASSATEAGSFSFDQFFAGSSSHSTSGSGDKESRSSRQRRGEESEEIEQFNAWLEGLKET